MPSVEQSVLYMKVTDALRDSTSTKISDLSKTYNIADFPNLLSLAVELSPLETVQWIVQLYDAKNKDFNEIDPKTGDTALHKAVSLGRTDIVRELMMNPSVDDTVRNKEGITAPELASTPEMEHAVSSSENKFAQMMAIRLKSAFKSHDVATLSKIYSNPRVAEILNINGIDPDTGRNVLHDSAAANDVRLVQFILAHGGDPLIRDRATQKLPEDMTSNEEIRRALNNAAKSKAILDQTHGRSGSSSRKSAPSMDGYLKKWTNITSGYKLRWFELKNGELCYFKRPEDTKNGDRSMRGSISLRRAAVRLDSSEKNKFEIRTPSTRFHLKASHPAETNKWVWALQNAITFARDEDKMKSTGHATHSSPQQQVQPQPQPAQLQAAAPLESQRTSVRKASISSTTGSLGVPGSPKSTSHGTPSIPTDTPVTKQASNFSTNSRTSSDILERRKGSFSDGDGWIVNDLNNKGDDDDSDDDYADEAALHEPQISAESLISRLSAIKDLMTMLVFQVQDETMRDAITTAQGSIDVLSSDIIMFERQAKAHLHMTKVDLDRSDKAQRSWASNYRDLEVQYVQLEGKIHDLISKGHVKDHGASGDQDDEDEFFDTVDFAPAAEEKGRDSKESNKKSTLKSGIVGAATSIAAVAGIDTAENRSKSDSGKSEIPDLAARYQETPSSTNETAPISTDPSGNGPEDSPSSPISSSDKGDEKSDKTEDSSAAVKAPEGSDVSQSKHKKQSSEVTTSSKETPAQSEVSRRLDEQKSFAGYEDPPREKLALDADNRPKLSLWGILKNLVGKDMTKMSLPVTFNECTSLLQRSAEDMEYVDLLTRAAETVDDGGLRMAYVAAFAGSSYSSTINRIAKPFNPLLGETYEYARPDKGYRLFAEQVSHHPPIGALMAESKDWDFYGESNVESKFYGRSFDINPLGLWYINLRPNKGADVESELYSFRKLTSSVVGIMLGSPVVDNYGDMVITNHTTGINAVISYKARGWRAASAYKLQGKIMNKAGKVLWTMDGQWNDKMYARKAGSDESVLLWQIHPRHKVPFNLTDFAVTLNALPERLKPWLPPTDTRLRPDQRAMEEGRYDDASDEKDRVENKQRQKRREMESSGKKHKPQWFTIEKHPVTGLDYYKPINDYWTQRAQHNLADKGDIF